MFPCWFSKIRKNLAYATQFLQEQRIDLTLQNLAVTSDLVVQLGVLDIDYGSWVEKLLPLIQDRLASAHDSVAGVLKKSRQAVRTSF